MQIDTGFVTLVLGFVGVIIVMALVGVILWIRRTSTVRVPAQRLSTIEITLAPEDREAVATQLREAHTARGGQGLGVTPKLPERVHPGRVLWVDDDPDTSMSETIALQKLGTTVTKTNHADAALAYLSADTYTALVFGIVPDSDLDAIEAFVSRARTSQPGIVTLGYAAPGVVTDAGDFTLVRDPSELVAAVIAPLTVS
ncbi:MAG: hypothetical protein ABGX78_08435 [Microbacterium sp.]|uniref:hypothetical protein n=1 Tax=Microbacterium TaxID=33882 RepID=UPI00311FB7E3|tara:strand:- start:1712 stop:2308 length:597 start_codon:yes stop_codon:yes gene_type:complete